LTFVALPWYAEEKDKAMSFELPPNIEAIAREKAALAGLPDVDTFVQRLIENAPPEQALLPPPSDPRIIAAINDGFAGGVEGEMDEAFWKTRNANIERHIASQHGPDA
jgi:hypothetical protein